jgi:cell division transport system permease protein
MWVLEIGMIGIGAIIGVAVMFIIATTVRLALYARAEEIAIMQLVGATGWFIKAPFVLEGMLQGFLGASLAVAFSYGLFFLLMTWLRPLGGLFIDFSLFHFLPPPAVVSLLLGGGILGGLGSMFSLRRPSSL